MSIMDELADTERRLCHATELGALVGLQTGDPDHDDPAQGASWDATRTVRAEVLALLLTGGWEPAGPRLRAVKLRGARIIGTLDLEGTELVCPLLLADCHIDEPVNLSEATAPSVRLPGCHLPALTATQLRTTGNLELNRGFTAHHGVCLGGAHIGGEVALQAATLTNPDGQALSADLLRVDQTMQCQGLTCKGEVRLVGAHIGGQLNLRGAHLANTSGPAMTAEGLTVDRDLFCGSGFTAEGEIRLNRAHIGGELELTRARLANPYGPALSARQLVVEDDMPWLVADVQGDVNLTRAHIQNLMLSGFTLTKPAHAVALYLHGLEAETLSLIPLIRGNGEVDLTNAQVGAFHDDPTWHPPTLRLRGFVYDTLENERVSVPDRLRWLNGNPGRYTPQIYDQLAAAYRRSGHEDAARKVAIAKQWRRRATLNPAGKLLNWLLWATVGYGYRTWQAAIWLAGLLSLGTATFAHSHITPTGTNPPAFHAWAYTLDVLLPIIDLGQHKSWQPQDASLYLSWTLIGAGWVLTTAVVAGLTATLKRD